MYGLPGTICLLWKRFIYDEIFIISWKEQTIMAFTLISSSFKIKAM